MHDLRPIRESGARCSRVNVFHAALLGGVLLFAAGAALSAPSVQPGSDPWQRAIELALKGDFKGAETAVKPVRDRGLLTQKVYTWLDEYEAKQAARKKLDQADFDKYVGYAKARIQRKEYRLALNWTLAAQDCAEDRQAFLKSDWLLDLVNDSLSQADGHRKKSEWRQAWRIYSALGQLFEREPRYRKLEREAITHLRLETMFKKENHWEEQIDRVRWRDTELALENIAIYYVKPVDFKAITESGLEQLLLLADSKSAQEQFEGLKNEVDRNDFRSRLLKHLKQVRSAPSLDRRACVEHFRRVVKKINPQTIHLPESLIVSELTIGALEPLDDFTTLIWPRAIKEFEKHTRGNFVGVGISITKNVEDEIEVVTPLEDTPAYRAGIQAGDVITKVDGTSLKGYSVNKVVETITGPKDTWVTLAIRRDGKEIEFPLKRARVKINSVKGVRRDPFDEERWDHWLNRDLGIGYIRVTNFQKNTVEDVENALAELRGLRGLILDLRGNPGGLLDSAQHMASLFLKEGDTIVSTRGRIKREDHIFRAVSDGAYSTTPLVVLVDGRSASASEIVSGAIRDNARGTVIGERTFGKGSVQNLVPLSRSGAKLKITTARYYLPKGDSVHREPLSKTWGVNPDIPVRLVRWERYNIYRMQRDANLLGPAKPHEKKADDQVADGVKIKEDKATDQDDSKPVVAKADKKKAVGDADGEKSDKDKLPPLEQPDENDRPQQDPQLDTALLLMRLTVVSESHPTLASAETETAKDSAKP